MHQKNLWAYIDGEYCKRRDARISILDHGFMYGDGVFEGIRAYNGIVFKLEEHVSRLFASAKMIKLRVPISKSEIIEIVLEILRRSKLTDAYIRIVLTRGTGPIGLNYHNCPNPSLIVFAEPFHSVFPSEERGVSAIVSSVRRDPVDATTHEIKSLNYLNSILAKNEAVDAGVDEAIMLDTRGFVSEATTTNIFIVKDSEIITPPPSAGILHGITRKRIMELLLELGHKVTVRDITIYEVTNADEAFLAGTYAGVLPLVKLKGEPIGNGKPGKITRQLIEKFRKITKNPQEGTRVYKQKHIWHEKLKR